MERALNILSLPAISSRCIEMTNYIRTTPTADLRGVYPTLLQHIFGWGSFVGWRLRSIRLELSAFEAGEVIKFLKADGPVFELAYRLMSDANLTYEFPVSALPVTLQRKVMAGDIPIFIANKFRDPFFNQQHLYSSPNLLLNPFELFFFHYAYAELHQNVDTAQQASPNQMAESIYGTLLDHYLKSFLPTGDGKLPVIPPLHSGTPNFMIPPTQLQSNNASVSEMSPERPSLFKASLFQNDLHSSPENHVSASRTLTLDSSETWRTEAFLNILITMWLSLEDSSMGYQFETVLPSVELVKYVRVIVRHFHFFLNTLAVTVQHPLEDVKRSVFPTFQKRLYHFLRYVFARWPLDNSFRIVYETWLSYIQPWRYSDNEILRRARDGEGGPSEAVMFLESSHCDFVLENLLFYTYLFQQMLQRLVRVDFTSTRSAHMLYRITKVYSNIENLKGVLYEIESSILLESTHSKSLNVSPTGINSLGSSSLFTPGSLSSLSRSFAGTPGSANSHVPPDFVISSLKLAHVKQLMRELEGAEFHYSPLFSEDNRIKISSLVDTINKVIKTIEDSSGSPPQPKTRETGLFAWISQAFDTKWTDTSDNTQDSSVAERGRLVQFLNLSRNHLIKFFNLRISTDAVSTAAPTLSLSNLSDTFEMPEEKNGRTTGQGVKVLPRGFVPEVWLQPIGNPDAAPVSSTEIPHLVSFSLFASRYINFWISPWAEKMYFMNNWKGRFARAVLASPVHYTDIQKLGPSNSIRIQKYLPPRVNLRVIATLNMPYFFIAFVFLGIFFRLTGIYWILVPVLLLLIYYSMRAVLEPGDFLQKIRRDFSQEILLASQEWNGQKGGSGGRKVSPVVQENQKKN